MTTQRSFPSLTPHTLLLGREYSSDPPLLIQIHADPCSHEQLKAPWLHLERIKTLKKSCKEVFPTVEHAYTTIPTCSSGQIGLMACCKDGSRNVKERP